MDQVNHTDTTLIKTYQPKRPINNIKAGMLIKDNYRLIEPIGKGSMGVVWKAISLIQEQGESRNPYVAIKFLSRNFKQHPDALKALVRELARYQKLNHPNIVRAYELNRMGNTIFMVMEYLDGISLKQFIKANQHGIPLEDAKPIIQNLGNALSYIHKEGIAHLDFKPDNIIYDPKQKTIKIIDFGIARLINKSEREKTLYDPGNLSAYTKAYASREMFLDFDPAPSDDIYALACVTYELLSGKHPFNKETALKAEAKQMLAKPIKKLNKNKAVLHALAFKRQDRTPTADKFLLELFPAKKKSSKKYTVIASIILILLSIFGEMDMNHIEASSNDPKPLKISQAVVAKPEKISKIEPIKPANKAKITRLLQQCKKHFDAKRFTTGSKGTAYQQVLKLDSNNSDAKLGLKAIEKFYIKKIKQAIYRQDKKQAQNFLYCLGKVNNNSVEFSYLKLRLKHM
ncbi:serine/threonine-protein kinase [Candidatus Marithrix sp. Canyon 246]|uniref:serine/threonine-protein kinase n=1 Tax=Candidatus Marithrix sp. Canyon 246 TaxID=1827136 RepID=UPI00084A1450|nr:serine/threonine-protein kinase [Candidatus Marithrix sp. Canyon 246]